MASAARSAVIHCPDKDRDTSRCCRSGDKDSAHRVFTHPGATTFTRTEGANLRARERLNPTTAALAVAYSSPNSPFPPYPGAVPCDV